MTPPPSATTRPPRSRPVSQQPLAQAGQRVEVLGRLAGRQNLGAGMAAERLERALEGRKVALGHVVVGDDCAFACAEPRVDQLGSARQQAGTDQHLVGAVTQTDWDTGHAGAKGGTGTRGASLVIRAHGLSPAAAGARRLGLTASASMISPTMTSCGTSRLSTTMSAVAKIG